MFSSKVHLPSFIYLYHGARTENLNLEEIARKLPPLQCPLAGGAHPGSTYEQKRFLWRTPKNIDPPSRQVKSCHISIISSPPPVLPKTHLFTAINSLFSHFLLFLIERGGELSTQPPSLIL